MAKILIKKLPEGFHIREGKVVKKALGGMTTGDQSSYGLVTTTPLGQTTKFNDDDNKTVRYSLAAVPKEEANLEAEGGETVLTDLNNDGNFELYSINGPRHSKGGVPMYLPEQSFIYSDTPSMMFKGEEVSPFGFTSKKGVTPATISRRYQLNDYYAAMEDLHADDIMTKSAELMLMKNMMSLSKLAFAQEAKKKFEEGVPMATYPYLVSQGIDPAEFTQKMEQMNKQEAQNVNNQISPEQQQQMMAMRQMMQQMNNPTAQEDNSEGIDENLGGMKYGGGLKHYGKGGGTKLDPEFYTNLKQVASNLGIEPRELLILMAHESGLNTSVINKIGATGLTQFTPATAKGLGTTIDALSKMTGSEQLKYVEKFLKGYVKPGDTAADVAMKNFLPAFANKPDDFVLGKKDDYETLYTENGVAISKNQMYKDNPLDKDNKGYYTVGDVKNRIRNNSESLYSQAGKVIKKETGVDIPEYYTDTPNSGKSIDEVKSSDPIEIYEFNTDDPYSQELYQDLTAKKHINKNYIVGSDPNDPSIKPGKYIIKYPNSTIEIMTKAADGTVTTERSANTEGANYDKYVQLENLINSGDPEVTKTIDNAYKYFEAKAADYGIEPPSKEEVIKNFLDYQKNNYIVADIANPSDRFSKDLDKGTGTNKNLKAKKLFDKLRDDNPGVYNGYDIDEKIMPMNQLFYQALYLADKENPIKKFNLKYDGPNDKSNWENDLGISKPDGYYGNNTLNQFAEVATGEDQTAATAPGTTTKSANTAATNTTTASTNKTPFVGPEPGDVNIKHNAPVLTPWLQDQLKLNAIAQRKREMFMPWEPAVQQQKVDYVLEDPTRQIAANQEGFNIAAQAYGAFAGPQALASRVSQALGKTMAANADTLAQVNGRNVGTINRGKQINAEYENIANQERARRQVKQYDDTQTVMQNYLNEKNFDREQYSDAMGNMLTNAANTYNLNTLNPYYNINPQTGGTIDQWNWKEFNANKNYADPVADRQKRLADIQELKNLGIDNPTPAMLEYLNTGTLSNGDLTEKKRKELEQGLQTYKPTKKEGGTIKEFIAPFYTGKTGY